VSKLAPREMARCAVTANVSHSYSLFFIASERDISREKEAKKFFCPPRTRDFNSPNSSFVPRENTYVKRPRLADTDAHTHRERER